MATKLDRVVTYHDEFPLIKLHDPLITSQIHFHLRTSNSHQHGNVVTYFERLPPLKVT